ncbi:MAG: HAD-IB family hydrolase [Anaerolineales bacterium]|nr:MAG: HAD-IB family hydrolase [Anaerolineales bacterium]
MIAAIFDLDGTLYTGHIIKGIARHHRTHRVKRLPFYMFMSTHMALWPLWRSGLLSEFKARELWARHMGWTVRGWTPQEAAAAFAWIAEQYVQPLVRPDLARLRDHQAAGHRAIMVSGTPAPLLAEIGRQLGVEETVGTPLVLRAGRYTGACELPVCQGPNKVLRLEVYLHGSDSVLWPQSYAYADSYTDLPLLERVGQPVAVYPDSQLAAHAQSQGWEILGEEISVARQF